MLCCCKGSKTIMSKRTPVERLRMAVQNVSIDEIRRPAEARPAESPDPPAATSYRVLTSASHARGPGLRLGSVSLKRDGWRFVPGFQASPSRKGWPTPDAALKGRVSAYELVPVEPKPPADPVG